ncbi:hypothetical protein [Streptomyces sp. NPDC014744]|uniref:hypothetical protein n=1 Tax=Streptomyces sp. NPDC014744 TaxID=3364903 RepID=UPI003700BD4B
MALPGSRTKTTDMWLLPQDEILVGRRIRGALPDGAWLCSQPGPAGLHEVHLHRTVEEALSCGGVQAFLLLPAGAAAPAGVVTTGAVTTRPELRHAAIVQLLRSRRVPDRNGEVFRAGRLAVRWNEPDVGPGTHQLLTGQTRLVWQALRSATRPAAFTDPTGRRTSGQRIGAAAHDLVARTGMPLTRGGAQRLYLAAKPPRR